VPYEKWYGQAPAPTEKNAGREETAPPAFRLKERRFERFAPVLPDPAGRGGFRDLTPP
jgi:hypothetical protein